MKSVYAATVLAVQEIPRTATKRTNAPKFKIEFGPEDRLPNGSNRVGNTYGYAWPEDKVNSPHEMVGRKVNAICDSRGSIIHLDFV